MSASFPLAPWHMWGTSQEFGAIVIPAAGVVGVQSQQLVRVNYRRPESWNFFFQVDVISLANNVLAYQLAFSFDLVIGVGRSSVLIPDFCRFSWVKTGIPAPAYPLITWATQVTSPAQVQDVSTPANNTGTQTCKEIVAEDIQCNLRTVFSANVASPNAVSFRATAYFTPVNHIRPDWFSDGDQFKGHETGGT